MAGDVMVRIVVRANYRVLLFPSSGFHFHFLLDGFGLVKDAFCAVPVSIYPHITQPLSLSQVIHFHCKKTSAVSVNPHGKAGTPYILRARDFLSQKY